jgi:iron complex transport system ATP-binding protein
VHRPANGAGEAGTGDPAETLRRVAALGPYFTVATGGDATPGWRPAQELYRDQAVLAGVVERVRRRLGTPETRVAASIFFQGWAARLWAVSLAAVTREGRLPALPPETLLWRDDEGSVELRIERPVLRAEVDQLRQEVVHQHLEPLVAAVGRLVPIAAGLLWGNAASALLGAARVLDGAVPAAATELATGLLTHDPLRGTVEVVTGGRSLRRSCCLFYRVPGGGLCGDCVLRRAPARRPG